MPSYQFGSSPRVRGTPSERSGVSQDSRFIPAGAGNTKQDSIRLMCTPVHPRGCGEHETGFHPVNVHAGSSPRVRGTRSIRHLHHQDRRFIPAGAGNTDGDHLHSHKKSVHPRGCGEHFLISFLFCSLCGSSPRVRGTPDRSLIASYFSAVHPRGCGEHLFFPANRTGRFGSSPRVRGTQKADRARVRKIRFIPAGAGNTRLYETLYAQLSVHPRGCGEHL